MEGKKAEWSTYKFAGNPNIVADELESLGDNYKPQDVVKYAQEHPESELHKCFTWDRDKAAGKWLVHEARLIIGNLVYVSYLTDDEKKPMKLRVAYRTDGESGYTSTRIILKNPDKYQSMLAVAKSELQSFVNKYRSLAEIKTMLYEAAGTL